MASNPPEESDDGILQKVALGIERAMEHCIKKYSGLVWTIAKRYVRDHSSAEDVVQETFLELWKSAKRYDPAIATESTFIGMLARRRAIDYARKESRRPQLEPLPDAESLPQLTSDPPSMVSSKGEDVRAVIKELPDETQKIFAFHFEQGMTHPEIAEKTGLPLGTVKTRLRRGLIEARNKLQHLGAAQPSNAATS
ncbi:MAG: RNA polymerase sigma factor [Akkermansiaceae bacterium]